jgi:pimeloyl-ACP methyl ester carboxylesterase
MFLLSLFWVIGIQLSAADELPRRASWQASFTSSPDLGMRIKALQSGTPLAIAGARVDDIVLSVNDVLLEHNYQWDDATDNLIADIPVSIKLKRAQQVLVINAVFNPREKEQYTDLQVEYGQIENDYGILQRTIVTYPKTYQEGKSKALPAIFLLQGLSCSSIEILTGRQSNYKKLLSEIVQKTDMLVMRVEKPGMGDSQGLCSQTNFIQELNGYERALQTLLADPRVDKSRVIVYGNSMGSAIAPYMANKYSLNGVISEGTFFRTWFEHMLEIERRIKQMQGLSELKITEQINQAYLPLYYGMLIEKRSYGEIIQSKPLLGSYNYHNDEHMYGRPMSYYHQLQEFNFAGHWQQVKVPVRIRYGTNDWIMSESDNHMIVDTLKRAGNNNVELYLYPKLDHWSTLHETAKHSFEGNPGKWEAKIATQIVDWAKALNQKSWRAKTDG